MNATSESSRREERRLMARARFYISGRLLSASNIVGFPVDWWSGMVAVYDGLVHAGIDSRHVLRALDVLPLTAAWPSASIDKGRAVFTERSIREGLDYDYEDEAEDAVPDAIDTMLASGVRP